MLDVTLIDYARDPLSKLYGAYRTCYTSKTPREVWQEIGTGDTHATREKVRDFVVERLKTGHVSPLEQVVFWFGISGVSRSLSHQFVRHRIGISFEQQSQRYVRYREDQLDFVTPPTIDKSPFYAEYAALMTQITDLYARMTHGGIPAEDARFVLPNATPTNFQVMVNLAELLHIGDLRLCWRAQWEIRHMMAKMRAEVKKVAPELAAIMQPKCGDKRLGYCDEAEKDWAACPLGKVRPHKKHIIEITKNFRLMNDEDVEKVAPSK